VNLVRFIVRLPSKTDSTHFWRSFRGSRHDHRPLRIGDIAVLCRTNTEVARFAAALSREGLPVAVARQGLARTPHVELAIAAYRWIADPSDRLAVSVEGL